MRDGEYLYLAGELGLPNRDALEPIKVYRPKEEVEKAFKRFNELGKLPVTDNHPENFLDLKMEDSYQGGVAEKPALSDKDGYKVIDCSITLNDKLFDVYNSGIKELSCGWDGEFEPVEPGKGYEFIQRFIDINHVALVASGRAGNVCRIADRKTFGGSKMLEKMKKILDKFEVKLTPELEQEAFKAFVSTLKVKDADEEEKGGFHVEMSSDDLVKFLVSVAGMDEATAKQKVSQYLGGTKPADADVKEAKEKEEAKDADVKEAKEKEEEKTEKKDADVKKDKEEEKEKAMKDAAAIKDAFDKGKLEGKHEAEKLFQDVIPVIRSGDFKYAEIKDKSVNEIKAMYVEKVLKEKIDINDAGLDTVYKIALKQKDVNKVSIETTETISLASEIEKINQSLAERK